MHISAKVDYGMRALIELASHNEPLTSDQVAQAQELPSKFLVAIFTDLRRADIVSSQRGPAGGYRLSRPAEEITVADVMRALDGPLAEVRGLRPDLTVYTGSAQHLQKVWIAARASLRAVMEHVSVADLVSGALPAVVNGYVEDPDAWVPRLH